MLVKELAKMRHFYRFATLSKVNEITKSSVKTMGGDELVHLDFCNTPLINRQKYHYFLILST